MILKYAMSLVFAGMLSMGLLATGAARADEDDSKYDLGMIPAPHIMRPQGKVSNEVVLISDLAGWGDKEKAVADKLVANGSLVIGIDYASISSRIWNRSASRCSAPLPTAPISFRSSRASARAAPWR